MNGIIFDIKHFAVHDGPGIRQTIFFKGCPLRCLWCHNPESQTKMAENIECKEKIGETEFKKTKTIGKEVSVQELIFEIEKDIAFFDESGGGVTFSGGEPMMQHDFILALAKECKNRDIHVALDTSGFAQEELFTEILPYIDLFLYDLKLIDNHLHKKYTGVDNYQILKNLQLLDNQNKRIVIRLPLIPGITTEEQNITAIADFMQQLKYTKEINLLPFHDISKSKYQRFKKAFLLDANLNLTKLRIQEIRDFFLSKNIHAKID